MSQMTSKMYIIALVAIALATTPAFVGIQTVLAAGRVAITQGFGSGQFACASPSTTLPSDIGFNAQKQSGKITGTFSVFIAASGLTKSGIITGGQRTASSFTFTGVENQNTACPNDPLTTVTITGTCGSAVDIFFKSAAGERGQFVGSVFCL